MSCQFPAICKVVARPVGKHLFPVNAVRRLRRRFRRNSATLAQRRSRSVRLCDKNGPFVYFWPNAGLSDRKSGQNRPKHHFATGRIIASASATVRRTDSSGSWRATVRSGTASAAAGPILPSAAAASNRTALSESVRATTRAGMTSAASGPMLPSAPATYDRSARSGCLRAATRAGMASLAAGPIASNA
jgi:hypothetical protein